MHNVRELSARRRPSWKGTMQKSVVIHVVSGVTLAQVASLRAHLRALLNASDEVQTVASGAVDIASDTPSGPTPHRRRRRNSSTVLRTSGLAARSATRRIRGGRNSSDSDHAVRRHVCPAPAVHADLLSEIARRQAPHHHALVWITRCCVGMAVLHHFDPIWMPVLPAMGPCVAAHDSRR